MLFSVIYKSRGGSEADDKRSLQLFTSWEPPFEFKAHWAFADGQGGVAIIEADDAAQVLEGSAPWIAFFDFDVTPVLPVEQAVPIYAKVNDWRDSVG